MVPSVSSHESESNNRQFERKVRVCAHRVSSSLLSPVDPSFRALSGRLDFTVRRHKFNQDFVSWWHQATIPHGGLRLLVIDSGMVGMDTASAEDARRTPTQSHTSPRILVYEDTRQLTPRKLTFKKRLTSTPFLRRPAR